MNLRQPDNFKWSREANIERYGRLLNGKLTEAERRFVERRLAEEQKKERLAPHAEVID